MNSEYDKNTGLSGRIIALILVLAGAVVLLVFGLRFRSVEEAVRTSLLARITAAFLSGMLSFISPCSLPILPSQNRSS